LKPSIPQYSVVVPVYRGVATLAVLTRQLVAFFQNDGLSFEIIFVYDCGNDNSWNILKEIKARFPEVVNLVRLSRNTGQHTATLCGFTVAQGKFIITMDEDLQHPPHQIARLIETQKSGNFDLVYGLYQNRQHHFFRNIAAQVFAKLISIFIPHLHPHITSFRLVKSVFARHAALMQTPYPFVDGHFAKLNAKTGSCLVEHQHPNLERGSTYNLRRLIVHAFGILSGYTKLPFYLLIISLLSGIILGWHILKQTDSFFNALKQNNFMFLVFFLFSLTILLSSVILLWRYVNIKHRSYPIAGTFLSVSRF